jgi:pyrroloquinoline-quinone synthase
LTKAHRQVEGSHREAAWRCFDHVAPADYQKVVAAMEATLAAWLAYRDEVAAAVGLQR